jgi:hypothetical protein
VRAEARRSQTRSKTAWAAGKSGEGTSKRRTADPALFALADSTRFAFRLAIASRLEERHAVDDLDRILFVLPLMVEALSHGVALRRPSRLSLAPAREEAVRAVLACLHS